MSLIAASWRPRDVIGAYIVLPFSSTGLAPWSARTVLTLWPTPSIAGNAAQEDKSRLILSQAVLNDGSGGA